MIGVVDKMIYKRTIGRGLFSLVNPHSRELLHRRKLKRDRKVIRSQKNLNKQRNPHLLICIHTGLLVNSHLDPNLGEDKLNTTVKRRRQQGEEERSELRTHRRVCANHSRENTG